jgi:hypothetical protein
MPADDKHTQHHSTEISIMNASSLHTLRIGLGCLALGLVGTTSANGPARCLSPQGIAEEQACAKAKEGPDALRSYVQRTRSMHGLHYWDYAPNGETARPAATARASTATPQPVSPSADRSPIGTR